MLILRDDLVSLERVVGVSERRVENVLHHHEVSQVSTNALYFLSGHCTQTAAI